MNRHKISGASLFIKHFIALVLFVCSSNLYAQTLVGSVAFQGNSFFSDNELKNSMVLKVDKQFLTEQFNTDLKSLRSKYRDYGFLYARITNAKTVYNNDSSFVDINITIDEGKQVKLGEIIITGNRTFTANDILKKFDTKVGDVLDNNTLNGDVKELLNEYEKHGSLFTKVFIDDISVYDENTSPKIRLRISVKEESKVKINNVRIKGNEDTKDKVILRELKINEDKTVTREDLQNMKFRLERLNIFEVVETPMVYTLTNKNESGLLVKVKEGNTNTFDGIIGYVPPANDKENGYFTGLINLSFRNLFGTARRLDARWQQETKSIQELELKYSEPYFFGLPLNVGGGFLQRLQDSSYTRRKFDAKGDILLTDKFTFGFSVGFDRIIPPDDSLVIFKVADSRVLYAGTEIRFDSRNNIFIPDKGILYKANYIYGDKKIYNRQGSLNSADQSFSLQRYSMDVDVFFSFFKRQSLLVRFFAGQVVSDRLEDADYYKVGGIKNVRGYREEQFRASRFTYGTIEMRYSFSRKSFASAFFDPGYYYRPEDILNSIPKQEGFIFGYGLGIRIETAIGVIGVNYAIGKDDGILDGKIHFGLINEF
ncbi:MAG: POTRA domain-containing protein [Ignavibacteriota bacterium]|nr:BamA/TamA family outer membrane protein [Ignavibacteriota bacterium]